MTGSWPHLPVIFDTEISQCAGCAATAAPDIYNSSVQQLDVDALKGVWFNIVRLCDYSLSHPDSPHLEPPLKL